MWAEVEAQGFDPENVESFTYEDEYVPRFRLHRIGVKSARNPYPGPDTHHNAVKLKDGVSHRLHPPVRRPCGE